MSPELEALLRADFERHNCEPPDRVRCHATFERLLQEALAKCPGTSREEFLEALRERVIEFRRAQRKISSLPPTALIQEFASSVSPFSTAHFPPHSAHGTGDGGGDSDFRGREFLLRAGGDGAVFPEQMAGRGSWRKNIRARAKSLRNCSNARRICWPRWRWATPSPTPPCSPSRCAWSSTRTGRWR